MSSPSSTLTTFEVTVTSTGTALTTGQLVWIHAQAHRASSFPPVETSPFEDGIQSLRLCMLFNQPRKIGRASCRERVCLAV